MLVSRAIITIILLALTGCVIDHAEKLLSEVKSQNITVRTPMAEDARCVFTDQKGHRWRVLATPGTVVVKPGHGPLTAICEKFGYKKSVSFVNEEPVVLDYMDMLEEGIGVAMDPSATVSKRFPKEIVIWMEPKEWKSEEHLRTWALEKRLYENQQAALRKAQQADRQRIEKRELEIRAEKEVEYRQQMRQSSRPPEVRPKHYQPKEPVFEDIYNVRPPKRKR